jgi:hypothetical protein
MGRLDRLDSALLALVAIVGVVQELVYPSNAVNC